MYRIGLLKGSFFLFIALEISSCYSQPLNKSMRCINIVDSTKIYSLNEGQMPFELNISYNVYYYSDLVLYRYFYNFDSSINGKPVFSEQRPSYFVHHKDSSFGRYYDSHPENGLSYKGRLHLDSIYKKKNGAEYDTIMSWKPDSSYWSAKGKIYNETYHREGDMPPYVYWLSYSKELKDIDQSYSKKLDSSRNMKLVKVVYSMQEGYSKKYKTILPRMEMYNEIKEIPVEHKDEVMFYFNKYEKECLKR